MRRLSLRWLLLAMVLLVLTLPLAGLLFLRMYESALIRQTESELIAQAAVFAASYKAERLRHGPGDSVQAATVPERLEVAKRPGLDLAADPVLPPAPDSVTGAVASSSAQEAGTVLAPVLKEAQEVTLAAIRIVDAHGVVVATTGADLGRSLVGQDEISRALLGQPTSVMRQREHKASWVPDGISRGSMLRVHVALPVLDGDRVLGAVLAMRTPADITQALAGKRRQLAWLMAGLLAIGTAVALAMSRLVTRPLALVTAQAATVAAGSSGAVHPLRRPGTREVAQLSAAIVAMAETLDKRASYVRTLAARIAHEFKTPLTATRGAAELLRDHAMSEVERLHFLDVIEAEVSRLDRLTRRLLDLARADMTAGSGRGPTPVGPVLAAVAARFADRGLSIRIAGDAAVAIDREPLEAIVAGLLDNVVAHGGPTVAIDVTDQGSDVLIRVSDDGPGISAANAPKIFDAFFTTAREQGGTGLGLPIIQAFVAGVGGSVQLLPIRPGTSFEVRLPAKC